MKLKIIGSNQTTVNFNNGKEILFSYNIPVAGFIPSIGYVRTDMHYSVTTSKHINAYLGKEKFTASIVTPDMLESEVN